MHPRYERAATLTGDIIGAAIEVHRIMGPGLIESIYEWCLSKELELRGFCIASQELVTIHYKTFQREQPLRFDLLIENCVLVKVKAIEKVLPIHKAKLLSYMKLLKIPIGLVINFYVEKLADGVSRLVLHGADR